MKKSFCLVLGFACMQSLVAQTVLYQETFESSPSVSLNTADVGGVASGDNPWIINNIYAGGTGSFMCFGFPFPFTVPTCPSQPGSITNPNGSYLHVTPQIAITGGGTLPAASYVAADGFCIFGGQSTFSKMSSDISTVGFDSVTLDLWWICGGSPLYFGEVYYSTNGGVSWTILPNPESGTNNWNNQTTWISSEATNAAWANQSTLRFGFRFISSNSASGSELDPGFAIDDLTITGYTITPPSCTETTSSFSASACESYVSPSGLYTWTTTNTYNDTIPNTGGCDSVITVNLTIHNSSNSSFSVSACDSYTSPSGLYTWTSSNTYMDTIPNTFGCDSIITVNLTINTVDASATQTGYTVSANQSGASYQWLDCDNGYALISDANDQSFPVFSNGSYAVQVTANGCSDTSSCFTFVDLGTEVLNADSGIRFFPNPASQVLTIQNLSLQKNGLYVKISDMTGREVLTQNLNTGTQTISIQNLSPGTYVILFLGADNELILTDRIMIE